MPKLLQIDTCLNMLSTGRVTEGIGKIGIERGWEVHIVHSARFAREGSCMHSFQSRNKLSELMHYAEGLLCDNHGLASRMATRRVVEYIKEIKPDIVHLHCIHGYYLNYKILFEYLNRIDIPVVWTFYDCWAFTGHCAHFVTVNCNKWAKEGCCDCPIKNHYPKSFVDRSARNFKLKKEIFLANKNLTIVSVSKWLDSLVGESFFGSTQHTVIYNGVDCDVFKPTKSEIKERYNLSNKKVMIAVASAWSTNKGLDDYKKLSSCLKKDYQLILIGLDEKQKKELPKEILGISRTNNVQELVEWYSVADVVMNLSYAETFGLTTIEGMACGTPSVVYNCTASPELVDDNTGEVVRVGDIEGVKKAIDIIVGKGKEYYIEACRKRAQTMFNAKDQFMDYMHLYYKLIKK